MDIKKHMETAWGMTLKFVVPLILMTLVMAVVSAVTLGILAPVTMAGDSRFRKPIFEDPTLGFNPRSAFPANSVAK